MWEIRLNWIIFWYGFLSCLVWELVQVVIDTRLAGLKLIPVWMFDLEWDIETYPTIMRLHSFKAPAHTATSLCISPDFKSTLDRRFPPQVHLSWRFSALRQMISLSMYSGLSIPHQSCSGCLSVIGRLADTGLSECLYSCLTSGEGRRKSRPQLLLVLYTLKNLRTMSKTNDLKFTVISYEEWRHRMSFDVYQTRTRNYKVLCLRFHLLYSLQSFHVSSR